MTRADMKSSEFLKFFSHSHVAAFRFIRVRLTDPFLRRLVDSADICQSVLANFFMRVALGEYDLEEPKNLLNLLLTMARNRVINLARDNEKEKQARQAFTAPEPLEQV